MQRITRSQPDSRGAALGGAACGECETGGGLPVRPASCRGIAASGRREKPASLVNAGVKWPMRNLEMGLDGNVLSPSDRVGRAQLLLCSAPPRRKETVACYEEGRWKPCEGEFVCASLSQSFALTVPILLFSPAARASPACFLSIVTAAPVSADFNS